MWIGLRRATGSQLARLLRHLRLAAPRDADITARLEIGPGFRLRIGEAAVVGVPHERWQERPVAFVVPTADADEEALPEGILEMLRDEYPKWWLPDEIELIDEIPKTATGKFSKKDLREQYGDQSLVEGAVPEDDAPEQE